MGMWVGRGRKARAAYGFDDIALVPGTLTINPNEVDISWELCGHRFQIPIIAAAMDGVVSPRLAIEMGRLGGLAVLNLEGIFSRYENPDEVLDRITSASLEEATKIIQGIYGEPIKEELIHKRISEIKKGGGPVVGSSIPQRAERFAKIAEEAGADFFVVQSTVTTARHVATEYTPVDLKQLKKNLAIPLIIGNVVTYEACLELMECGTDALLIGVGPGAACTSREVLGLGVPQGTATADAAEARDFYYKRTGRYVPIITDGGMTTGGDICKALASGADAVMIGSAFARAKEAPGRGYHWGMATPHSNLPRGTRIRVGIAGPLEQILFGPAFTEDGTLNLVGAIRTCMGSVGARTIRELQQTELIISPTIKTEGTVFQQAQQVGHPRERGAHVGRRRQDRGSRFRRSVHTADCPARSRDVRVLRDLLLHPSARADPVRGLPGDHPLWRPVERLRGGRAAATQGALRVRRAGSRNLLRHAGDGIPPRRPRHS